MNCHKVVASNINTGETLHFKSLTQCGSFFGMRRQNVYEKIMNGIPTRQGWVFDYGF